MVTYIYPYRNRDLQRIKRSLESLKHQDNKAFKVIFVDYGSDATNADEVSALLQQYAFVTYVYSYTEGTAWNRSKAVNIGVQLATTDYVLTADIDMIFMPSFNDLVIEQCKQDRVVFFKVGYLSEKEDFKSNDFKPESFSNHRAKGICLYPKTALERVNGFDEFFNCWGSEDEDIIQRLEFLSYDIHFYEKVLIYHQYHKPFKTLKHKLLSKEISFNQARFHNDKKRRYNKQMQVVEVNNHKPWGRVIGKKYYDMLTNTPIAKELTSYKTEVDFFLMFEVPRLPSGVTAVRFTEFKPEKKITVKHVLYKLWTIRNKDLNAEDSYSLKEVNDIVLKFMIYEDLQYHLTIETNFIELRIYTP